MSSKAILTIDDIGSANTPAIVDYLCDHGIQAVMFAVGENVEKFYDETIYALKKGMIIGNHTYTHIHASESSYDQCIEEIEKMDEFLDQVYKDAGVNRVYRPFRFPYGDKGIREDGNTELYEALQKYLRDKKFSKLDDSQIAFPFYVNSNLPKDIDTLWSFDFAEYQIREGSQFTADDVYKRIEDRAPVMGGALLQDGSNHILLFHAHDETEAIVPKYYEQFLNYCMTKGVQFVEPRFQS